MAESSLSAKSASPRELKRSYRAAERTWAGTPSSMAALIVHRPSPESDTRPWKPLSFGSLMSAEAVRSLLHRLRRHVEDHALLAPLEKPPHHVGAHAAKS